MGDKFKNTTGKAELGNDKINALGAGLGGVTGAVAVEAYAHSSSDGNSDMVDGPQNEHLSDASVSFTAYPTVPVSSTVEVQADGFTVVAEVGDAMSKIAESTEWIIDGPGPIDPIWSELLDPAFFDAPGYQLAKGIVDSDISTCDFDSLLLFEGSMGQDIGDDASSCDPNAILGRKQGK